MPTADRRPMVARAIAYFLRQDHPARELVVLDDGHDRVRDLIPDDPRVRYAESPPLTLGAKRNAACELARGDVIVHWDDDDWSAPHRLRYQLEQLDSADVGGASRLLYLDPAQRESWLYAYAGRRPWVAGNTLCYTADTWRRAPFAELAVGEDSRFVSARGRRIRAAADHRFAVGIIHAANASPKRTDGAWWNRMPLREVTRVLGDDARAYLPG
jgi:glycosyltransferase involved in cell wall biosynthesis